MAWEWVSPTATAVAGISGVFFTWLTAKQGRESQAAADVRAHGFDQEKTVRAEKREVYVGFLDGMMAIDAFFATQAPDAEATKVFQGARQSLLTMRLVAPDAVVEAARALLDNAERALEVRASEGQGVMRMNDGPLWRACTRGMGHDLGYVGLDDR